MALSYKDVAEILKIIDASDCEEVVVEMEGSRLVVRKGGASAAGRAHVVELSNVTEAPEPQEAQGPRPPTVTAADVSVPSGSADGLTVRSPMVGTFYGRPSPDDAPFVEVGSKVAAGDPLCLIEVMKLFTTIEAPTDGVVGAILADEGQLVAFDQPLFVIRIDE